MVPTSLSSLILFVMNPKFHKIRISSMSNVFSIASLPLSYRPDLSFKKLTTDFRTEAPYISRIWNKFAMVVPPSGRFWN